MNAAEQQEQYRRAANALSTFGPMLTYSERMKLDNAEHAILELIAALDTVTAERDAAHQNMQAAALEVEQLFAAMRAERDALAAELAQVDDYGMYCYEYGVDGSTWRMSFGEWLTKRGEPVR
jgi:hypothetical protein